MTGTRQPGNAYFKALFFVLFLGLIISFSGCKKKKEKWYYFVSNGDNFSMEFPVKPSESSYLKKMPWGGLPTKSAYSGPNDNDEHNIKYSIIYTHYPDVSPIKPTNSIGRNREILGKMMKDVVDATEGTLRSNQEITINGYPGIDFILDITTKSNQPTTLLHRLLLAKNTLYMIEVTSKRGEEKNEATERFLNSFTL